MKKIGFYREHYLSEDLPSLQSLIGESQPNSNVSSKMIDYLLNGLIFRYECLPLFSFFENKPISRSKVYLTDGKWIWPIEYVYYIEKYGLPIDVSFKSHIEENNCELPKGTQFYFNNYWENLSTYLKPPYILGFFKEYHHLAGLPSILDLNLQNKVPPSESPSCFGCSGTKK